MLDSSPSHWHQYESGLTTNGNGPEPHGDFIYVILGCTRWRKYEGRKVRSNGGLDSVRKRFHHT